MILPFAASHPLDQSARIGCAVDYGHIKQEAVDFQCSFPDAFISADRFQRIEPPGGRPAGQVGIGCAERSLHHAAGVAEDDTGAGGLAHQPVIRAVRQTGKVNARLPGPDRQFPSGDDIVHIPHGRVAEMPACRVHLRTADFRFFRCAGSHGHIDDLFRIQSHPLGKIGFDGRTLHTNGTFGAGKVGKQFRIIRLGKPDPGRTAAGELGQGLRAGANPVHQFAGLLHNG